MANLRRRSVLFAPAFRLDLLSKMARSRPDCVVLDLEDGTPSGQKEIGRSVIARALAETDFGGAERIVRLNSMDSPDAAADIAWLRDGGVRPDAIMLPKVQGPADLTGFETATAGQPWPLWILPTESARGYANLWQSVSHPSVTAVIWAAEDLAADIGALGSRDDDGQLREVFRVARAQTLLAAKAAGISAIDTTYVRLRDLDGLRREAAECAAMGFDGKAAIHPAHVEIINEVFQPDEAAVADARRLIAAFEAAGGGAVRHDDRMVDAPHYKQALRILARAGCRPAGSCPVRQQITG
jgi:citrate lyase subunit beta / citryl-CoA lyase